MSTHSRQPHISLPRLLLASFMLVAPAFVSSQPTLTATQAIAPGAVPASIHADRYGRSAWECPRGFQERGETCVAIKVPANAYLSAFGNEWECNRGYQRIGERCAAVKVPGNAHADDQPFAPGWECDRGYLAVNGTCTPILVPANAYAVDSAFSGGWECDRGYRRDGKGCAAVTVPAHGFLQRGGDDWDCDRSFRKQADACVPVEYPRALTWTGRVMAGNASADSGGKARFASRWSFPRAPISPIPAMTGLAWTAFAGKAKRASLTD